LRAAKEKAVGSIPIARSHTLCQGFQIPRLSRK